MVSLVLNQKLAQTLAPILAQKQIKRKNKWNHPSCPSRSSLQAGSTVLQCPGLRCGFIHVHYDNMCCKGMNISDSYPQRCKSRDRASSYLNKFGSIQPPKIPWTCSWTTFMHKFHPVMLQQFCTTEFKNLSSIFHCLTCCDEARERLRFRELQVSIDSCSWDPDGACGVEGGIKFERAGNDWE